MHTLVWAVLFLVVVGGGSQVVRYLYRGATIVVEADPAAAAVLKSGSVKLSEIGDPLSQTLRVGEQIVRPGRYRIAVDWQGATLAFSTGEEFAIARGERLTIKITGTVFDLP